MGMGQVLKQQPLFWFATARVQHHLYSTGSYLVLAGQIIWTYVHLYKYHRKVWFDWYIWSRMGAVWRGMKRDDKIKTKHKTQNKYKKKNKQNKKFMNLQIGLRYIGRYFGSSDFNQRSFPYGRNRLLLCSRIVPMENWSSSIHGLAKHETGTAISFCK
jgi:hypothetical protein